MSHYTSPQQQQPPQHVQRAKYYRNDPYRAPGRVFYFGEVEPEQAAPVMLATEAEAPPGTCHTSLWGQVGFTPYPTQPFDATPTAPAGEELVRVFIGQLPYFVTEMQLAWLCHTFGGGHVIAAPERIMKRQANGDRLPTGCVHAYTTLRAVEEMARGMHKRMLVDDTGVWHARTPEEFDVLSGYVAAMKKDKTQRVPNRPYDTVVVQLATSTFMPANPMPLSEVPTAPRAARGAGARRPMALLPPPSYEDTQRSAPGWM